MLEHTLDRHVSSCGSWLLDCPGRLGSGAAAVLPLLPLPLLLLVARSQGTAACFPFPLLACSPDTSWGPHPHCPAPALPARSFRHIG
jgi:hypothetical protein